MNIREGGVKRPPVKRGLIGVFEYTQKAVVLHLSFNIKSNDLLSSFVSAFIRDSGILFPVS